MSRIKGFALISRNDAFKLARQALSNAHRWLDKYAMDRQCDDEDREVIDRCRREINRALACL